MATLFMRNFCDDGYKLTVVLDVDTVDLEPMRRAFTAARDAAGLAEDLWFEIQSAVLARHIRFWAFAADMIPQGAPGCAEDVACRQLVDAPWGEWAPIDADPAALDEVERHAHFRWGRISVSVDFYDAYLRIAHKHADSGLGVFDIDLDPRVLPSKVA